MRITSDAFKPSADLPDTLQFNQLVLTGEGDLKNGYQLLGNATLPADKTPESITLEEAVGLIEGSGRVTGVRAKTPDGDLAIRADLVIGADGRHSRLRRAAALDVIFFY